MTTTITETLIEAIQHHSAGELCEAGRLYHAILKNDPQQPDAWHLMGVLACQTGNHNDAIKHISRAIQLNPNIADYYNNLAVAYETVGDQDMARRCLERACVIDPTHLGAPENLTRMKDVDERMNERLDEAVVSHAESA